MNPWLHTPRRESPDGASSPQSAVSHRDQAQEDAVQEPAETTLTHQDDSAEIPMRQQPKKTEAQANIHHVSGFFALPKLSASNERASSEPDSEKGSLSKQE